MHVTGIFIYPVKATSGTSLTEAPVLPRGLANDRRWVVVDEDGQFLHQRIHPRLALVSAKLRDAGALQITATGMAPLRVERPSGVRRLPATVWRDTVDAADAGEAAAVWFSHFMGFTCRLAFMDEAARRPIDEQYNIEGGEVSFADAMPLLVANEASLQDLNRRLDNPLPMSRFRPNVVVSGGEPWAEDHWKSLRIGEVEFEATHRCVRCVVTTIDQQTAVPSRDGEPLRTLATFRRSPDGVSFGHNLAPRSSGPIRIGDAVEILA